MSRSTTGAAGATQTRQTRRPRHSRLTLTRVALALGFLVLTAFVYVVLAHGANGGNIVGIVVAMVALIAAGNLLYGRSSPGAKALARTRDAQEAHDRAADLGAEARRATTAAERRGERYCPMDPGQPPAQSPPTP